MVKDERYKRRKNVLVMGDILEDVRMVKDSVHEVVLKVGFLNDIARDRHLKEEYMETFDLVIVGDGSLDPVNDILRQSLFADELRRTI